MAKGPGAVKGRLRRCVRSTGRNDGKMQTLQTNVGIILLLMGLVFIGQGSGYFPYPASSFMISQTRWIYYGAGIAVVGAILIFISRR